MDTESKNGNGHLVCVDCGKPLSPRTIARGGSRCRQHAPLHHNFAARPELAKQAAKARHAKAEAVKEELEALKRHLAELGSTSKPRQQGGQDG